MNIIDSLKMTLGCSVTQRIRQVKQPRGGYINYKMMKVIELEGGGIEKLNSEENIHANLVGLAVDYLTRFMAGVKGLDDKSTINAVTIENIRTW